MKNKIVLFLFAGFLAVLLSSYSGGYAASSGTAAADNRTGATGGTTGCASGCHTATTSIGTIVELDSAGVAVTSYHPGAAYTVKIAASNTSGTGSTTLSKFGFQVSVVKAINAGTTTATNAGTWGTLANTQNSTTGSCSVIEHTAAIAATSGSGAAGTTYVESVPWTAPVAGTGSVKLYGVLNAVNANNRNTGDFAQVATAVTITEAVAAAVVASVSISQTSGTNPTCVGSSVTFTATPTNGGTQPAYVWKVNGAPVGGATASTFTTTTLATGSIVTCVMTSNLSGVTGNPATSAGITMTINPTVTPSVHITPAIDTICAGTPVLFTATPINGGTGATYVWKVNGTTVGSNKDTFSSNTLTNTQTVSCVMTSTATCASPATATSNTVSMVVHSIVVPTVNITASATAICAGSSITFVATPTNGGSTPGYQWKAAGVNAGTNKDSFTTTALTSGQAVTCVLTSSAACASPATATSNSITPTINPVVVPAVNITATGTIICSGAADTFRAVPVNGGTQPTYQWKVNGTGTATGTPFITSALTNGQIVTCVITSNATCASPATATSNADTVKVISNVTPSVSISPAADTICAGTTVLFTATPVNGGTAPTYTWKVNGTATGSNKDTFGTSTLSSGQAVTCMLTSSLACVSSATATSNAAVTVISASQVPAVHITASATAVCAGSPVTFVATPTNGGTAPSYQWKIAGTNAGANKDSFTTSALTSGQAVTCVLTSSSSCASPTTATSNSITPTINTVVTPAVSITASAATICSGSPDTFRAVPANGGTQPSYQWKVNGTNTATGNLFITSALAMGAVVTCIMTSNASCPSPATATSNADTVNVNATVVPAVIITTQTTNICAGTKIIFAALPSNSGTSPAYQWKVNGVNAGSNSDTFGISTLANGQHVSCVMTSSAACATPATVTSNNDTITVNSAANPTLTIHTLTDTVCSGSTVVYTATQTGGGTAPVYQWKVNGVNTITGTSYTTNSLTNGQVVSCVMTSSASCAAIDTAASNGLVMTVNNTVTPSINIFTPLTTVCPGSAVLFTATITNGGTLPTYQWKVNSTNAGTSIDSFTTTALTNGQTVTCVLTSTAQCASPASITSNPINMTVASQLPVITISATSANICAGTPDTFTAQVSNGGTSPSFQWKVNGSNAGTNSSSFSSAVLTNGAIVKCVLTSSLACASPASVTSTADTVHVTAITTPTLSIHTLRDTVCQGTAVSFSATGTNLGTAPTYQWLINGANAGTDSAGYTTVPATSGTVSCLVTSSAACVSPATATSPAIAMDVLGSPVVTIIPSGAVFVCPGDSVLLTASGASTYSWTNADTSAAIWIKQSGTYSVSGSNGSCAAIAATAATVTIDTPSVPTITQHQNQLTASAAPGYQWTFNDAVTSDTTQMIAITQNGSYTVTTRDAHGCAATSITYFFSYVNGISGIGTDLGVKLYPIPNQGSFVVEASGLSDADLAVYDIYGQKLYEQKLTGDHTSINHADLAPAMYFVTVSDKGRTETIKMQVVKE